MGSPLGRTISEFCMSHIENKIFEITIAKPNIYVHSVDDIVIATHSYDEINKLKKTLEKNSVLNFTTWLNITKKSLSLMYLQTPQIITNSLHLHIKSLTMTIPLYLPTTVNVTQCIK